MAAKEVTQESSILTETVAQSLNIFRGYNMSPTNASNTPSYTVNLTYVDNQFLLNTDGTKNKVLAQGFNSRNIYYTPEQVGVFFMTPMKKADGTDTVLGEFLADLMDAAILEDLNKTV